MAAGAPRSGLRAALLRARQRTVSASAASGGAGYDYIVVGAGSAGCAVAERLSRDPRKRVLLMEAGPKDGTSYPSVPWVHIPVGYFRTMHSRVDWRFKTDAATGGLGGRSVAWPRGRVLGGSSSVNGLLYVRGQPEDYDDWAAAGCDGWGWEDVRPVFTRLEAHSEESTAPAGGGITGWSGDADHFGGSGPLSIQPTNYSSELCDAFIAAVAAQRGVKEPAGVPVKRGAAINSARQHGVGYFQQTARDGFRCSSAVAYLNRAHGRRNLDVVTDAAAQRVRVCPDTLRAEGVDFFSSVQSRHTAVLRPGGEVVVSAGAIGSPQLLQLSGVGTPPELTARCGWVRPLRGRAGTLLVGENLQDHLQLRLVCRTRARTLNTQVASYAQQAWCGVQYALWRGGPLSLAASQVCAFVRTDASDGHRPDAQFHFQPLSATHGGGPGKLLDGFDAFTASVCQLRPRSVGRVRAVSPVASDPPRIEPQYLTHPEDQACAVAMLRYTRRVCRTAPLAALAQAEVFPGARCGDSDAELLEAARMVGESIYHPVGTCKMGPAADPAAVVDPRLRVHGVAGLRVVDASIMPVIPSGNTNGPTIMVAEKAADMIIADAGGAAK